MLTNFLLILLGLGELGLLVLIVCCIVAVRELQMHVRKLIGTLIQNRAREEEVRTAVLQNISTLIQKQEKMHEYLTRPIPVESLTTLKPLKAPRKKKPASGKSSAATNRRKSSSVYDD